MDPSTGGALGLNGCPAECYMHLPENACVLHVDTFNEAKDNRFLQAQKKLLRK